jgi:hypothetical protein
VFESACQSRIGLITESPKLLGGFCAEASQRSVPKTDLNLDAAASVKSRFDGKINLSPLLLHKKRQVVGSFT